MDPKNLPGSIKTAILIQFLGGKASQEILNTLEPVQRELVQNHISQMGPIPPDVAEKVAKEFAALAHVSQAGLPQESRGNKDRESYQTGLGSKSSALKAIQSMDPELLSKLFKDEHPQTIAVILAHLEPLLGSKVLSSLPDEIKPDVAVRVANLGKVSSEMIEEINSAIDAILKNDESSSMQTIDGISQIAGILNQSVEPSAQLILDEIGKIDPELAEGIKQKMFIFDDLVLIDDRGLQKVLRNVETRELAIALKAASEEVKQKIFKNMSERASQMLNEEIDDMPPVRVSDVEDAQQALTRIIRDMADKGELIISGRGGEEFV